jgi:hypothetical protein
MTLTDYSGNGNNSISGFVYYVADPKRSLSYSGEFTSDGEISYPFLIPSVLDGKTTYTVEFWMYMTQSNSDNGIFCVWDDDGETYYSAIGFSPGNGSSHLLAGYMNTSGGSVTLTGTELSHNEWHNIMLVIEHNVGGKFYIDGTLVDSSSDHPQIIPTGTTRTIIGGKHTITDFWAIWMNLESLHQQEHHLLAVPLLQIHR